MLPISLVESILIYLADDDEDDCVLFQEALKDLKRKTELVVSKDGVLLMKNLFANVPPSPTVLFLDINMPRKNGFECLKEIKQNEKLKNIPVVIFSTAVDKTYLEKAFQGGADFYVQKPSSFLLLRKVIEKVLTQNWAKYSSRNPENFLLSP